MHRGCRVLPPPHSSGNLHKPAEPQPPQTTCPAQRQPQGQAPPRLLQTAEAAFELAVPHGMPTAGHSHAAGRALCAGVAECFVALLSKSPQTGRTATTTTNHLPSPATAPSADLLHHACCTLQRLYLTLQCPMACPGLATHTLAGLCALWLPSAASSSTKSPLSSKTATPANHLLGPAAAPSAGRFTTAAHCRGCI